MSLPGIISPSPRQRRAVLTETGTWTAPSYAIKSPNGRAQHVQVVVVGGGSHPAYENAPGSFVSRPYHRIVYEAPVPVGGTLTFQRGDAPTLDGHGGPSDWQGADGGDGIVGTAIDSTTLASAAGGGASAVIHTGSPAWTLVAPGVGGCGMYLDLLTFEILYDRAVGGLPSPANWFADAYPSPAGDVAREPAIVVDDSDADRFPRSPPPDPYIGGFPPPGSDLSHFTAGDMRTGAGAFLHPISLGDTTAWWVHAAGGGGYGGGFSGGDNAGEFSGSFFPPGPGGVGTIGPVVPAEGEAFFQQEPQIVAPGHCGIHGVAVIAWVAPGGWHTGSIGI